MTEKAIHGVYAALLTPRMKDDSIDVHALTALIKFLIGKGISSFAVNGATGEYCLTTPDHLRIILATIHEASEARAKILCGIGAAGSTLSIQLAAIAQAAKVQGLLLPAPYFFPYDQQDLDAFCREIAGSTNLPILLYNLPQFTSGIDKTVVRKLILEVPNIIGIKDSGGTLNILRDLTECGVSASRMVGNDNILAPALAEGLCDGVISGVACALPELVLAQYALNPTASPVEFQSTSGLMREIIGQLDLLPTPWGIKWMLQARGIIPASFSQPQSESRLEKGRLMINWLNNWLPSALSQIEPPK